MIFIVKILKGHSSLYKVPLCVEKKDTEGQKKIKDTQGQKETYKVIDLCDYGINPIEMHWSVHNPKTHKYIFVPADGQGDYNRASADFVWQGPNQYSVECSPVEHSIFE